MNISIIIPTLNSKLILEKNLPKIVSAFETYANGNVQLVISDDHSEDDTFSFITSQKETIEQKGIACTFVHNKQSKGFSNNIHSAVSHAVGDVLILLNTDVSPEPHFLNPLLKHFSDEQVFAVGCLEETTDEKGNEQKYGRAKGYVQRGLIIHSSVPFLDDTSTFWVSCGSGAFRKSIWDKLKGLDKLYNPFYWEDIDLSYRAVKSGYKILFESQSVVHHQHEKGTIKKTFSDEEIKTIAYRNQFIFFWKNVTDLNLFTAHIMWIPYHLFRALLRRDLAFISGFFRAIFLLPSIIQSRGRAKRLFRHTDAEVLRSVK